ncbi:hypothetical protein AVEN_36000-1 [Araneus ventricosus]|uniref:Uncharacterized protein n=1 Tax=Araneus ventricosus TaxID=182803 RepID=A0A4Y2PF78_ARAVE|nr:hypothetical protein AVEN_36000-1 [Araneus ventricosus]
MVPTLWRSSAQGIKCPTVLSGHIPATSHRVWWLRSPDMNPLDFFCGDTSNSECMQPLHQHCRNFETVLWMFVPACHLPCCVQREMQSRVQMCTVAEGHHFEHDR